jgi:hypothetical protein
MGLDLDNYDFENPIGFDGEYSNFGVLQNIGKKIKTVGSNIKAGAKDFVKNPIKAVGNLAKDTGKNIAKAGVKVGQFVTKVFPLTLAGRGGFLYIVTRNGFGLADRLAPLYLEDKDPVLRKYKPEAVKQIRDSKFKIENAWKNLGGEINPFKKAILDGRGRKPRVFKKGDKSFDGTQYPYSVTFDGNYEYFGSEPIFDMFDGEVYTYFDGEQYISEHKSNFVEPITTASLIISGLGVVATFIGLLKSNKVPEQPFADGTPEAKEQGTMPTSGSDIDPNAPILSPDGTKVIDPTTGETFNTSDVVKAGVEISKQTNPDGTPKDAKFLGMPRKVGIGVAIGVGVLAIAGIVFAIVKKKK